MSEISVSGYAAEDIPRMREIWNQVVGEGDALPQEEGLTPEGAEGFFAGQDHVGIAKIDGEAVGLYILHPNGVGRCGHMSNASYAVDAAARGQGVGELLVRDCIEQARARGYRLLVFNAVVRENFRARALYEKLGFKEAGRIPGGFRTDGPAYHDIHVYYLELRSVREHEALRRRDIRLRAHGVPLAGDLQSRASRYRVGERPTDGGRGHYVLQPVDA